jgi:hypothetical protein
MMQRPDTTFRHTGRSESPDADISGGNLTEHEMPATGDFHLLNDPIPTRR